MSGCNGRLRRSGPGRWRGPALATAGLAALALLALRLAEVTRVTWSAVAADGPVRPDDAVSALAATSALALILWLFAAASLSLAAPLAGNRSAAGRALGRVTRRVAPLMVRNAAAGILGVVVATSPAAAHAASAPPSTVSAGVAAQPELSPAWLPPAGTLTRPATSSESRSAPAPEADLNPGWIPDRPPNPPGHSRLTASVASAHRRAPVAETDTVVVRRGDTLWSIAARHLGPGATDAEIALDWPRWFTANRSVVGADPDRLRPGERLRPPPASSHAAGHRPGTTDGARR